MSQTLVPREIQSTTLGRLRVHAIQAGGQKLDGGAMFGVVPRVLWERRIAPDEHHRIQLGMRVVLVEHEEGLVLVDTGVGNKETPRFREIYGVENAGADGGTWLDDALATLGFTRDDVRLVINTHLHFDHAGGNTHVDEGGVVRPTFRRARYVVQRGELAFATRPNERTVASYFPRNWDALQASAQLDLIEGERDVVSGIRVVVTPGHVPHHQSVVIDGGGGAVACCPGDVCPTAAHLALPWIMGYDVEPLVTLESKRALLGRAAREEWLLIFPHDAERCWGRVGHDGKGYRLVE